jgi:hypothetical protein
MEWPAMISMKLICGIGAVIFLSYQNVHSEDNIDYSRIDEELLLHPPSSGEPTDKVIIYERVRNKTINKALDSGFDRIENMMFVDTLVETTPNKLIYAEEDECN